ncbi:MAG: 3,4-dihydroxy-2-butanone-4-phosphate synthase [Spirochaetaceae bacterium]|nr:MAG: 3,4-dihydroxy-2-butanone-4-phosphate synthase [Spirochaetaceae bacterium]
MTIRQETLDILDRVRTALEQLKRGGMVLVVDDFDRENEADLLMATDRITADDVNFMAREGRGLICQTITVERAAQLGLGPQEVNNNALHGTAFTISVDAASGVASGISAADRAVTMRLVASEATDPSELARPGHVFPIVAQPGGVFARRGHTEAGCDLARLAGFSPSAVICEVMDEDGTMARGARITELARKWELPVVSVEDVVHYRSSTGDALVRCGETVMLPTRFGTFTSTVWLSDDPGCRELVTISSMEVPEGNGQGIPSGTNGSSNRASSDSSPAPLVRLHSECLTGEAFGSTRCDCGPQLDAALEAIGQEPGVVVYLRQEGRGIGLVEKYRAYGLQDRGVDTYDANVQLGHRPDERNYAAAGAVLRALGLTHARLATNNPEKFEALSCAGIETTAVSWNIGHHPENQRYLATKAKRFGHAISAVPAS